MFKIPKAQLTKETDELGLKVKNLGIKDQSKKWKEMKWQCTPVILAPQGLM